MVDKTTAGERIDGHTAIRLKHRKHHGDKTTSRQNVHVVLCEAESFVLYFQKQRNTRYEVLHYIERLAQ